MAEVTENNFKNLYAINVNDYVEQKNGLTYLSWANAWAEFKKVHPDATYEVKKFENGIPYAYDPNTGYMVYTSVTVDGLTHEMWLPVMDGNNKAMKAEPYTIKTKYKVITVQAATMFDVNKTIMRCLTKNLAMFGLGLYIYAGEDLPDVEEEDQAQPVRSKGKDKPKDDPVITAEEAQRIKDALELTKSDTAKFLIYVAVASKKPCESVDKMTASQAAIAMKAINQKITAKEK